MLSKCRRDQWSIDDLDWSRPPRQLDREDEIAIVQYFTDMSRIELLAGKLFAAQAELVDDPTLKAILWTFDVDETRHSDVATRLAAHYDVHGYRQYAPNPDLVAFEPHFENAIRSFSPEVANMYITIGELMLDIALLRSIDDFVDDAMSAEAMHLINQDESRHIAIDYFMAEYYCTPEFDLELMARRPLSAQEHVASWISFAQLFHYGAPFFRSVFFEPMDRLDPDGRRMTQTWRRIQMVSTRPEIAKRPIVRFMLVLFRLFNHPIVGPLMRKPITALIGVDERFLTQLYDEVDRRWAQSVTMQEMAEEALAVKYA